jgi:Mg-chelatase subunit ChlD
MKKKKETTEIVFILDESSSMMSIKNDTIKNFNNFLEEQKTVEGKAIVTLITFSSPNRERIVIDSDDIKSVESLTETSYTPNGTTALYDTIGRSIIALKDKIKSGKDKKPDKILFVIITDGQENSSVEYTDEKVFKMIKKQQKRGWKFIYLGANQDSFVSSSKIGIDKNMTLNYSATSDGVYHLYDNISNYVKKVRTSNKNDITIN